MNFGMANSTQPGGLRLLAKNLADLEVLSALVQDSVLRRENIKWIKKRYRFSLLVNRFRWELISDSKQKKIPFSRLQAILIFDTVVNVSSRGLEHALENEILSLLTIDFIKRKKLSEIGLIFSGSTYIKLKVELINVLLKDLPTGQSLTETLVPSHKI